MKKIVAILVFLILLFSRDTLTFAQSLEVEDINVDIEVSEDNRLIIKENLSVLFYDSSLHGIYRDIPVKTYFGKPVKIENVNVIGAPYTSSKEVDYLRIQIGDPDEYASASENYEISYIYNIGDDRNDKLDELYFDIIGTSWQIPINNVSFSITLPSSFDPKELNFTYGDEGSTNSENITYEINGNTITGSLNTTLYPGQALTVALPLPEGYFKVEKEIFFYEKAILIYPVIIGIILILGLLLKIKYGTNKKIFHTPEFYPPEGLSPLEIGYIYDGQIENYDITSMLIYWASKGYMKIIDNDVPKGHFYFQKLRELPSDALQFEKIYFNDLFSYADDKGIVNSEKLNESFYKTITDTKSSLINSFKDPKRAIISNMGNKIASVLVLLGFIELFLFFSGSLVIKLPYNTFMNTIISLVGSFFLTAVFATSTYLFSILKTRLPKNRVATAAGAIILSILGFIILVAVFVYTLSIYIVAAIFAFLLIYFYPYAKKRTKYGDEVYPKLLGLKLFIENAEKDRIHVLVNEDPSYFYHILPYAMVLGVTDKWAEQFEGIAIDRPNWYENNHSGNVFTTILFISYLNHMTTDLSNTMTSVPIKSSAGNSGGGSFGGGFSGGGSGGGGGGGW